MTTTTAVKAHDETCFSLETPTSKSVSCTVRYSLVLFGMATLSVRHRSLTDP